MSRAHGDSPGPRVDVAGLAAFVAVARLGSVGRAAGRLRLTQPSVSARLRNLERTWGTRLFRRGPRGMTLTPEGARLLPPVESALRELEELDRLAGLPVAQADEVRVGAGDALGRERLPAALRELLVADAQIGVRIVEGPGSRLLDALRNGEIDVALVVRPGSDPGEDLDWGPLLASPVDVLLPPGTLPRGRRSVSPAWLSRRRTVGLQPGSSFRRHLERAFAARGSTFRPALEVGNLSLVRRFVAAGLGVAPVPAVAFGNLDEGPRVERCRLAAVPAVRYERAVRRGVPIPRAASRLLELLS